MLELRGLSKSFGSTDVIKNLSLSIEDGEFFALLGPSGCGKTTLLRMLAGFERPSQGEICWKQKVINSLSPDQRPFNMVFQRYALFPHLNVQENLEFGLKIKGESPNGRAEKVREALQAIKMSDYADRSVATLSGGQQQRIALARALINQPELVLLDEPLSALDLKLREEMQVELRGLQRKFGHTFIFVTHDQEEALTLANRVAVMNRGRIEQVGTPQEIYEYPQTHFVAKFIGRINCFSGMVKTRSEMEIVSECRTGETLVSRVGKDLRPLPECNSGAELSVLVRPEKMRLTKEAPRNGQNWFKAELVETLYFGANTEFYLRSPISPDTICVIQPNLAMTSRKTFRVGERVFVSWSAEDCILILGPNPDRQDDKILDASQSSYGSGSTH